jgi:hypothetical protein
MTVQKTTTNRRTTTIKIETEIKSKKINNNINRKER